MRPTVFLLIFAALAASPPPATAEGLAPSLSDWGAVGLLQDPTARFLPDGTVTGGYTYLGDLHRHFAVGAQLLPGLEATLRDTLYPSVYGLSEPGLDVKLRLLKEGPWWPALAIGGRDVAGGGYDLPGRGRFAGEYLVASRRWWNVDLSLGLGWGALGGYGHLPNPLGFLGKRYRHDRDPEQPASRGPRAWFTGDRVALFGGLEWHTPIDGLSLKLDYSGDSFRAQQKEDPGFLPGLPVNVGLSYRPWPWLDLGAGVEQGRRAMLRLSAHLDPDTIAADAAGKDSAPPPVTPQPPSDGGALTAAGIASVARGHQLPVGGVELGDDRATLWLEPAGTGPRPLAEEVGRAARVLADTAPPEADRLTIVTQNSGLPGVAVTLLRRDVARAANARGSAEEIWSAAEITPASAPPPEQPGRLSFTVHPASETSLFEQGVALAARSYVDGRLFAEPARGLILGGGLRANLSSSVSLLDSNALPAAHPVRSDLWAYAETPLEVERLYAAWLSSPAPHWATRLSVGHFEEMFGGFGGEVLYHPLRARWGLGLDLNRVWKRPAGDPLRVLADSGVTTGQASLYLEAPGAATTGTFRVGRYLAGDWGGTVELARVFDGGVRLSAHLTWTNGPTEGQSRIGGRLEQGIALVIPFGGGQLLPLEGAAEAAVGTLGRDVGQRLRQPLPLYDTTVPAGFGRLAGTWSRLMK